MKAIRTSELQNIGTLYWVSMGRMVKVTAVANRVDAANQFCEDNPGQSVLNQTPDCELILIADENDRGHKISF